MDFNKKSIDLHKKNRGKIEIRAKVPVRNKYDLSLAYTPGVGAVCLEISKNKEKSWQLTNRANQVAIISDGTAVLGLGNIGPEAGMPVMEGKSVIFKNIAGIDAVPLVINTTDTDEIVNFVKIIEPSFGGINLEDISAPRCFEILRRLEEDLSIPVFHDDQDGTAIVTLAALINACRVTGKVLKELKVLINGAGAAGIAIARLLSFFGVKEIILLDSRGAIYKGRSNLNKFKKQIAEKTNKKRIKGQIKDVLAGNDVFIGVSKGNLIHKEDIKTMNKEPIVFAMANPEPEILPDLALKAGAVIAGTGRSDFKNQINNALIFPGLFRGLLDHKVKNISQKMKIGIAIAVAYSANNINKNKILPNIIDKNLVKAISQAVKNNR